MEPEIRRLKREKAEDFTDIADVHLNGKVPSDEKSDEKKKNEAIEKIKARFMAQLEESTAHGWPNIARRKNWCVRIMWFILLLAAFAGCGYMIYRAIYTYFQYPISTQISNTKEIPSQFPTVTFCNINPFIKPVLGYTYKEFLDYIFIEQGFNDKPNASDYEYDYYDFVVNEQNINDTQKDMMDKKQIFLNYAAELNDSSKQDFGYSLNQTLITCFFNNQRCNLTDFNWYYSYDYGNCFSFNTGKDSNGKTIDMKKVKRPGK